MCIKGGIDMNTIINELKSQYNAYPFETEFVVQSHYATSYHYDFRIQKGNVAPSWAIPKAKFPKDKEKFLAVRTSDHPLEWMRFSGIISSGYGAGKVEIVDRGKCIVHVWRDSHIIVQLFGEKIQGFYRLIKMKKDQWLIISISEEQAIRSSETKLEEQNMYNTKFIFYKESQPYQVLTKNNKTEYLARIKETDDLEKVLENFLGCKPYKIILCEEETEQSIVGEDIIQNYILTYKVSLKEEKLKEGFSWTYTN